MLNLGIFVAVWLVSGFLAGFKRAFVNDFEGFMDTLEKQESFKDIKALLNYRDKRVFLVVSSFGGPILLLLEFGADIESFFKSLKRTSK